MDTSPRPKLRPKTELPYDDIEKIERVVWAEARGEGVEGRDAVRAVILNRLASDRFPDTVDEILTASEFEPVRTYGSISKIPAPEDDLNAQLTEFVDYVQLGEDAVDGRTFFQNTGKTKKRGSKFEGPDPITIGSHTFYRGYEGQEPVYDTNFSHNVEVTYPEYAGMDFSEGGLATPPVEEESFWDKFNPLTGSYRQKKPLSVRAADTVAEYTPLTSTVYTANDINEELDKEDPSYLNVAAMVGSEIIGAVPLLGDVAQNMIKKGVKSAADEGADVTDDLFKDTVLEETAVSATKGAAPKSTVKAYKLFRTNPDKPGELFPLFVNADKSVETGKWVDAEVGPLNEGGKVKSKIGALAFRPGWHAGDYIAATHIGGKSTPNLKKPDYRPANQVWAEVEMPNDVDWQTIANQRARIKKDGTPDVKTAHITDQVPDGGFYRYKTNSNMQGNWLIGGSMKVNKQLSDLEAKDVQKATGIYDLPSLPELIDQKSLSFGDLTQVAQKELKDYYPEKFAEMTAEGFALGGLAVARKGITTKEGYEMADKKFQLDEEEADLNNDGNLSTYEKARGEAVQKATKEEDEIDMYHGGMMEPVDPVSGNPIPIGSTAEEVRDDIEINISQGEYVLPADVVKWHGLEKIMMMQEEAKMGLMAMDAMGLIPAVEAEEPEGEVCPKCDGEGCDHCNDTGYHTEEEETPEGNKVEKATVEVSEEEPEVRETEEYAESDYSKKTSMYGMVKKPKFTFIV